MWQAGWLELPPSLHQRGSKERKDLNGFSTDSARRAVHNMSYRFFDNDPIFSCVSPRNHKVLRKAYRSRHSPRMASQNFYVFSGSTQRLWLLSHGLQSLLTAPCQPTGLAMKERTLDMTTVTVHWQLMSPHLMCLS